MYTKSWGAGARLRRATKLTVALLVLSDAAVAHAAARALRAVAAVVATTVIGVLGPIVVPAARGIRRFAASGDAVAHRWGGPRLVTARSRYALAPVLGALIAVPLMTGNPSDPSAVTSDVLGAAVDIEAGTSLDDPLKVDLVAHVDEIDGIIEQKAESATAARQKLTTAKDQATETSEALADAEEQLADALGGKDGVGPRLLQATGDEQRRPAILPVAEGVVAAIGQADHAAVKQAREKVAELRSAYEAAREAVQEQRQRAEAVVTELSSLREQRQTLLDRMLSSLEDQLEQARAAGDDELAADIAARRDELAERAETDPAEAIARAEEDEAQSAEEAAAEEPAEKDPAPEPPAPELSPEEAARQEAINYNPHPVPIGPPTGTYPTFTCPGGGTLQVDASIEHNVRALLAAAWHDGIDLCGWGFRPPERQIELRRQNCGTSDYAIFHMPPGQCSPPTARPGTSNHEGGLAIDFRYAGGGIPTRDNPGYQWLAAHAAHYGLFNLPSEPWHWSTTGR